MKKAVFAALALTMWISTANAVAPYPGDDGRATGEATLNINRNNEGILINSGTLVLKDQIAERLFFQLKGRPEVKNDNTVRRLGSSIVCDQTSSFFSLVQSTTCYIELQSVRDGKIKAQLPN